MHTHTYVYTHVYTFAFVREISIYLCPLVSPFRSDPIECVRHTRGPYSRRLTAGRRHRAIVTFTVCFRWIFSFIFIFIIIIFYSTYTRRLYTKHTLYIYIYRIREIVQFVKRSGARILYYYRCGQKRMGRPAGRVSIQTSE